MGLFEKLMNWTVTEWVGVLGVFIAFLSLVIAFLGLFRNRDLGAFSQWAYRRLLWLDSDTDYRPFRKEELEHIQNAATRRFYEAQSRVLAKGHTLPPSLTDSHLNLYVRRAIEEAEFQKFKGVSLRVKHFLHNVAVLFLAIAFVTGLSLLGLGVSWLLNPGMPDIQALIFSREIMEIGVFLLIAVICGSAFAGMSMLNSGRKFSPVQSSIYNVPLENRHFVGRRTNIHMLARAFRRGQTPCLLHGLGGVGKTEVALQFVYIYARQFQHIFWCDVSIGMVPGLAQCLERLIRSTDPWRTLPDTYTSAQEMLHWFSTNKDWLLVLDNADEPQMIYPYLGRLKDGRVIITSRARDSDSRNIPRSIELLPFTKKESRSFLQRRTGDALDSTERECADRLALELGYLPLALEQAAAHVETSKSKFSHYLTAYVNLRAEVFPEFADDAPESQQRKNVRTTWEMNFRAIVENAPACMDLLRIGALTSAYRIPEELIVAGSRRLGPLIADFLDGITQNPLLLDDLLAPALSHSLITRDPADNSFSMHPLVQEVLIAKMKKTGELNLWLERLIGLITSLYDQHMSTILANMPIFVGSIEYGNEIFRVTTPSLETHAARALLLASGTDVSMDLRRDLFIHLEKYLHQAFDAAEFQKLYEQYALREDGMSNEELAIQAIKLNNYALGARERGDIQSAISRYKDALEIFDKRLPEKIAEAATTRHNLGLAYALDGRFDEAIESIEGSLRPLEFSSDLRAAHASLIARIRRDLEKVLNERARK